MVLIRLWLPILVIEFNIFLFYQCTITLSFLIKTGQTPIMLAENDENMMSFLKNYLQDIQNTGPNKIPWRFEGAWQIYGKFLIMDICINKKTVPHLSNLLCPPSTYSSICHRVSTRLSAVSPRFSNKPKACAPPESDCPSARPSVRPSDHPSLHQTVRLHELVDANFPYCIYYFLYFHSDADVFGYNIFNEVPLLDDEIKPPPLPKSLLKMKSSKLMKWPLDTVKPKTEKCDSNSNIMFIDTTPAKPSVTRGAMLPVTAAYKNLSTCTVVLNSIDSISRCSGGPSTIKTNVSAANLPPPPLLPPPPPPALLAADDGDTSFSDDDSDGDLFEIEEAETPHVPLYHLRDEGTIKWALLTDLCYILKIKSKDSLLKQVNCIFFLIYLTMFITFILIHLL